MNRVLNEDCSLQGRFFFPRGGGSGGTRLGEGTDGGGVRGDSHKNILNMKCSRSDSENI